MNVRKATARKFCPNWTNLIFFSLAHSIGLLGYPLYLWFGGSFHWPELIFAFVMYVMGGMGVTIGYHRALSHLSLKMSSLLKAFILFCASTTAEGSALVWCSDHRRHHKFEDTEKDPYNILEGFWWAHMGWLLGTPTPTDFSNCPDLQRDPLIKNQHKYYLYWLIISCFLFPLGVGFLFGRPLAFLLLAGFTRLFVNNHSTFLINSYAHYFGRRPYSLEITAKDSLFCSLLAFGEGWHNFHHKFPFDYRNGHRFYHYDPSKWFIRLSQYIGLASNLKETAPHQIYRARIQAQRHKMVSEPVHLKSLSDSLDSALQNWASLQLEWQKIKADMSQRGTSQMKALRRNLQEAKAEFKIQYALWRKQAQLLTT